MTRRLLIIAALTAAAVNGMGAAAHGWLIPGPEAGRADIAALERRRVDVPGPPDFKISFLRAGPARAPRLIYVHGTPGAATAWADYLVHPRPDGESIAFDRPGFGETEPRLPISSLAAQARAALAFAGPGDAPLPILIGHSLGGPIICRAAADQPDRIGALVVLAGSLDPDLERLAWYQYPARWPLVRSLLPRVLTNANAEVWPLKDELRALEKLLPRITCPVVIVHGRKDGLVPPANADWLAKRLTGSARVEMRMLDGQDHFLIWNNRPAVEAAIGRAMELALSID